MNFERRALMAKARAKRRRRQAKRLEEQLKKDAKLGVGRKAQKAVEEAADKVEQIVKATARRIKNVVS
jgi:hypothetical protein